MITAHEASARARTMCQTCPIIPVLVANDVAHARPLAEALVAGGLTVLEVTLRTEQALDVIAEMAKVEGAIVGAGTVLSREDVDASIEAGATFAVSPGATDMLLDASEAAGLPMLPGAASASEAMRLLERGYDMLKFFPAEAAGGVNMLKSLGGPLPQIGFCPTGGVSPKNAASYLALDNVICAGGSWVAPAAMVEAGDWAGITALAKEAAAL
jgi:2-dehydro-3-deoxyphosphogluconate aldolase/(4S)-4-hydroxy-2-oxoglutarate aldolase